MTFWFAPLLRFARSNNARWKGSGEACPRLSQPNIPLKRHDAPALTVVKAREHSRKSARRSGPDVSQHDTRQIIMRIIDLHCYPNTKRWIDCQGPYVEA